MFFLRFDSIIIKLIITVVFANFFPIQGKYLNLFKWFTTLAIAFLFFMHGAKLSHQKIIAGSSHWRLHLWIICSTFIIFPLIGILIIWWHPLNLNNEIYTGFIYLCILPATVQSSIALTSIAGGNVAAAVCSASTSSFIGVFISPLLLNIIMNIHKDLTNNTLEQITKIIMQLLLPFVLGHFSRRWISYWIERKDNLINKTDQISILLIVYLAFSEAVINRIWQHVDIRTFLCILIGSILILCTVLSINFIVSRLFRFNRAEEIVVLFCGSKKSLANGIPMANILFPISSVGMIVLPLMIFHQVQLLVCSFLARKYRIHKKSQ
ncbi:bile acid:sodium symporter family protein [Pantoea sp. Aalb]|uniref:bile acid:sodium symporter family protein n=1 Tax=Pantoea sp. Aalb TaxID=2576762 RepID=UPI0013242323|nr:bile acid:sodium symporter family protein [Pantoea sp. Aalb]MXP67286.1 bile acid:sodium symporter [Pantoea sp. Aalb]